MFSSLMYNKLIMKYIRLFILFIFCTFTFTQVQAQMSFRLKSAPADLSVYFNGELIKPSSISGTIREYRIPSEGTLRFSASGYNSVEWNSVRLPVVKGQADIKLEKEKGVLKYIGEYKTGS